MTTKQKRPFTAKRATYIAAMTAIILVSKEALSSIANVEPVTLLVCLFTVHFGFDTLYAIYVFALVEGMIYGFHPLWWIPYLYVWTILSLIAHAFRKETSPLLWAGLMGIYGLCFGFLCSMPYFAIGQWSMGFTYFVSGLGFDLVHCVANFCIGLFLWIPLTRALSHISYE